MKRGFASIPSGIPLRSV